MGGGLRPPVEYRVSSRCARSRRWFWSCSRESHQPDLSHELSRGNDRLGGKKIVIWEFAARELALGNWKSIEMELRKRRHLAS
jgi:hypothetical protein